jgi:hypothetical protein
MFGAFWHLYGANPILALVNVALSSLEAFMPALQDSASHQPQSGSPYCADQNCPYCKELRATYEMMQAGRQFRLTVLADKKPPRSTKKVISR